MERLHRHQIYPIVLLIKFKSTKQIKEVKDTRYSMEKVSAKAAKEMYEHASKLESEYRHYISGNNYHSSQYSWHKSIICTVMLILLLPLAANEI